MVFDLFRVEGYGSKPAMETLYVFAVDASRASEIARYAMRVHRVELIAIPGYSDKTPRWELPQNFRIEEEGADPNPWRNVGDDEVTAAFEAMPRGRGGFLIHWGYLTFARAIEAKVRELNDPNFDRNF